MAPARTIALSHTSASHNCAPCAWRLQVRVPNRPNSEVSPSSVYSTQYPFTASSVMLTLRPEDDYAVEVMLFGGAEVQATRNLSLPACSESLRLRITYTPDAAAGNSSGSGSSPVAAPSFNYSFGGGWEQERMGWPRVMPDATLLPNGIVILLNGAGTGLAGDSADGGQSRANEPTFYAEMYVPDASPGARWFSLERSQIARMCECWTPYLRCLLGSSWGGLNLCTVLAHCSASCPSPTPRSPKFACPVLLADHSTAVLTTNGTILVAGCDRCAKMRSDLPFSAPRAKAEYRNEIFYPPFWYDMDKKPRILTAASNVTYGQRFNVTYTGENNPNVTVGIMLGGDAECVTDVSDSFEADALQLTLSPLLLPAGYVSGVCCPQLDNALIQHESACC